MVIVLALIIVAGIFIFAFMQRPEFGKPPSGERLERIKRSPNYKNGQFQNLEFTPSLTEGYSMTDVLYEFLFTKRERLHPAGIIPAMKTNLLNLPADKDVLVWFGHSSYYMQIGGKKILVDPQFSGNSSPIPNGTKAFRGTNEYTADDMPVIDYLFITHDHWDHLDHKTMIALLPKIKKIFTGLGTGSHLEYWGYDSSIITELDWYESINAGDNFMVHSMPARHFSGRGFKRNKTLWTSFVLERNGFKIFIGGDSGYGKHFAEIGRRFGGFDLAILENGQYDKKWKYIHMMPEEVLKAAKELGAKMILPVHSSKFALANHAWDDPLKRITEANRQLKLPLITPVIGQPVDMKDSTQKFSEWWVGLE